MTKKVTETPEETKADEIKPEKTEVDDQEKTFYSASETLEKFEKEISELKDENIKLKQEKAKLNQKLVREYLKD